VELSFSQFSQLLACPTCQGDLIPGRFPEINECATCHSLYPVIQGIPSFADRQVYWGEELDLHEMQVINAHAEQQGWESAVEQWVAPRFPSRAKYIREFFRSDWRFLFPLRSDWTVLDVGAGWGTLAVAFGELCRQVVALESSYERTRFIQTRVVQDGLANILPLHGTLSAPPLTRESFDLVILNGVLEWLGWSDPGQPVASVQRHLLQQVYQLLKPGGYLYIGIENRFGISYWLGAPDHSYLRYTSLMPRPLAHWVTWMNRGHTYRTYTYSPFGYRRLLHRAGFSDLRFYAVMPNYSRPIFYWQLGDGLAVKRFAEVFFSDKPFGLSRAARLGRKVVDLIPNSLLGTLSTYLMPHLLILACKPGEPDA
jgi:SAM-dependent methyltransferase/uncharacterized protein YbaR (Trm112 family)